MCRPEGAVQGGEELPVPDVGHADHQRGRRLRGGVPADAGAYGGRGQRGRRRGLELQAGVRGQRGGPGHFPAGAFFAFLKGGGDRVYVGSEGGQSPSFEMEARGVTLIFDHHESSVMTLEHYLVSEEH